MSPAVLESKPGQCSSSTRTGTAYRLLPVMLQSMVLKVAPPLVITESQIAQYLDAIEAHLAQSAVRV